LNPPLKYLPWDVVADTLAGRTQDGDVLAFETVVEGWKGDARPVMQYYLHAEPVKRRLVESLPMMADSDYLNRARQAIQGAQRVWAGYDPDQRPWRAGMFESLLAENGFVSCGVISNTPDLFLELYSQPTQDRYAHFTSAEAGVRVDMNLVEFLPRAEDRTLYVTLDWNLGGNVPLYTYSAGIHVTDEAGNLAVQADYGLPNASFGCASTPIALAQLPPGRYSVYAVVYAWETGVRLQAQTDDQTGDSVLLGTFQQ